MNKTCMYAALLATLAGCASSPPLAYHYYPAMAATTVQVMQTLDCNSDKTQFIVTSTPSIITAYASDKRRQPFTFDASSLGSRFADLSLTVAWYDDGRLKSINESSTGQGEAIIKSALTFVGALGVGGAKSVKALPECGIVAGLNGGKPVSLVYQTVLNYDITTGEEHELSVSPNYQALYDRVKSALPILQVKVDPLVESEFLVTSVSPSSSDTLTLTLAATAETTVRILSAGGELAKGTVTVPSRRTFDIPIPKAKAFGNQTFSLGLSEAGVITTVGYGKTTGATAALNSVNNLQATVSPSDSARASAIKAEADVMAQTARLAKCQAHPDACQ